MTNASPLTPAFEPLPGLGNAHLQTVVASRLPSRSLRAATWGVPLPDGDRLTLEVSTPEAWRPEDGTALLVHGLAGCHRSTYMVRLARKLHRRGVRAIRLNLRGCGSGAGLARRPYYGGCGHDVVEALRVMQARSPSPTALIGFSLGGNIVLSAAADLGAEASGLLEQVIVVCPAADLSAATARISRRRHRIYDAFFVQCLIGEVRARERAFPDLPRAPLSRRMTLRAFDDVYTARQWGFDGADDYYARASAAARVGSIRCPTRAVFALDDPLIDPTALDRPDRPACVEVIKVPGGGHLGFLAPRRSGGVHWLDPHLLRWVTGARAEEASRRTSTGARAV